MNDRKGEPVFDGKATPMRGLEDAAEVCRLASLTYTDVDPEESFMARRAALDDAGLFATRAAAASNEWKNVPEIIAHLRDLNERAARSYQQHMPDDTLLDGTAREVANAQLSDLCSRVRSLLYAN